jgi:hypothetical protein
MTSTLLRALLTASVMSGVAALAHGQASKLVTRDLALEVAAGSIVLPSGPNSTAVFAPCGGCAPKSFPATADTVYRLRRMPVTVTDLKAAITARPDLILTVVYSVQSGQLVSITADIDPPAPRRTP